MTFFSETKSKEELHNFLKEKFGEKFRKCDICVETCPTTGRRHFHV